MQPCDACLWPLVLACVLSVTARSVLFGPPTFWLALWMVSTAFTWCVPECLLPPHSPVLPVFPLPLVDPPSSPWLCSQPLRPQRVLAQTSARAQPAERRPVEQPPTGVAASQHQRGCGWMGRTVSPGWGHLHPSSTDILLQEWLEASKSTSSLFCTNRQAAAPLSVDNLQLVVNCQKVMCPEVIAA